MSATICFAGQLILGATHLMVSIMIGFIDDSGVCSVVLFSMCVCWGEWDGGADEEDLNVLAQK